MPIYLTSTWHQLVISFSITRRAHLKRKKMSLASRLIIKTSIFRIKRKKHFLGKMCCLTLHLYSLRSCLSRSALGTEPHLLNRFHRELVAILPGFPSWIPQPPTDREGCLWRLSASGKMMFNSQQDIRVLECTDWAHTKGRHIPVPFAL